MVDVDEFLLSHHGVKGQKWGIRNDKGHEGERVKTKKLGKLDEQFAKRRRSLNTVVAIHNRAAELTNKNDIARINNKPEYKGQDFTRDSPLRQKYYKEHQSAFIDNVERAAAEQGTNASGTKKYKIIETPSGGWDIDLVDVKHSDDTVIHVKVTYDKDGYITSLTVVDPIAHGEAVLENVLEHHGVKGQKWGVRNKKSRVKKSSSDHKKVSELRKKKTRELSNKQLQSANARANLERNFKSLNPGKVASGQAAVNSLLGLVSTAVAVHTLVNSAAGKAAIEAGKKFLKR